MGTPPLSGPNQFVVAVMEVAATFPLESAVPAMVTV
jgi:hypothetical protein